MKEKLVNTALLIASFIFSFLALEVLLRAYHGEWGYINFRFPQETRSDGRHPIAFDAELGWVPNQGAWPDEITILEDGIRSNGSTEVPDTTEPIFAVGDSYTWGSQVSDRETWPALLEKFSGRRVTNGGTPGYGIDQAFLRARRILSRYRFSTVIFSFIPEDIRRCQMSVMFSDGKPYFDFKDGRLTLENVPVPPPSPRQKESELLIALEHSRLVHSVMKKFFPTWWAADSIQVQDLHKGVEVACALLHELEGLTKSRRSELIILVQHGNWEDLVQHGNWEDLAVKGVLSCLSDPATRVLDLAPALSELKAKDPSTYDRLYKPSGGHMTAEGNQFVAREILKILTQSAPRRRD